MNDGSELQELFQSNAFDIQRLKTNGKLKDAQNVDLARQLRDSFALLREARDLLGVVFDTQLHEQIQALIKKIDSFYPQAKEK